MILKSTIILSGGYNSRMNYLNKSLLNINTLADYEYYTKVKEG